MASRGPAQPARAFRRGLYHRRMAIIFGLQLLAIVVVCLMGFYDVAPMGAVLLLIVIISALAWFAAHRQWAPVSRLARAVSGWDEQSQSTGLDGWRPDQI